MSNEIRGGRAEGEICRQSIYLNLINSSLFNFLIDSSFRRAPQRKELEKFKNFFLSPPFAPSPYSFSISPSPQNYLRFSIPSVQSKTRLNNGNRMNFQKYLVWKIFKIEESFLESLQVRQYFFPF